MSETERIFAEAERKMVAERLPKQVLFLISQSTLLEDLRQKGYTSSEIARIFNVALKQNISLQRESGVKRIHKHHVKAALDFLKGKKPWRKKNDKHSRASEAR